MVPTKPMNNLQNVNCCNFEIIKNRRHSLAFIRSILAKNKLHIDTYMDTARPNTYRPPTRISSKFKRVLPI